METLQNNLQKTQVFFTKGMLVGTSDGWLGTIISVSELFNLEGPLYLVKHPNGQLFEFGQEELTDFSWRS